MPETDLLVKVIVDTIPIGIVAYAISISLSRMFAVKHAYEIDSNQVRAIMLKKHNSRVFFDTIFKR